MLRVKNLRRVNEKYVDMHFLKRTMKWNVKLWVLHEARGSYLLMAADLDTCSLAEIQIWNPYLIYFHIKKSWSYKVQFHNYFFSSSGTLRKKKNEVHLEQVE